MSDTLLVLGGSFYHLEAIRAAGELGLRVISADGSADAPGHLRAHRSFAVEVYDVPALLEICRSQNVRGVLALTSSASFLSAVWICQALGLRSISPDAADTFADKLRFRQLVTELFLPHPQTHVLKQGMRIPAYLFDETRWVIKPDRAWASRGVFICATLADFERFYPITLSLSPTSFGMLERHITGQAGIAQGILRDGRVEPLWLMDRTSVDEPYTSLASLRMPSRVPQHLRKQLITSLELIFQALEVKDCLFNADFIAGEGKIHILSITPTLAGYGAGALIKAATGVDLTRYAILDAMGKTPELPQMVQPKPAAMVLLSVPKAGRLTFDASAAEGFLDIPWIRDLRWDKPAGASVRAHDSSDRRVGQFTVLAQDRDQLDARIAEALRRLNVRAQ